MAKKVVFIGGGLSAQHAVEALMKKDKTVEVTMIQANMFVEWPIAMTVCLVKPELHEKALATDRKQYELKGVTYKYAVAAGVDIGSNQVKLANPDGSLMDEAVDYDALVVATGFGVPLVYPGLGVTLDERREEVKRVGDAIKNAGSVVIAGGGPIALEMAGEIRIAYPDKKVVMVCRKGILEQWPEKHKKKVEIQLKNMNIEVLSGAEHFQSPAEYDLQPGSLKFGQQDLAYDVFIPAFSQGPNTKFLESTGMLDQRGRIEVNENLQSVKSEKVFAMGVSNVDEPFIGMAKLEAQWTCVASNVAALLSEKPLKPHKEGNTFMKLPPMVLIGHGPEGYGFMDFSNLPPPIKCCCCNGLGGWPCCPPCWPCCGCAGYGVCPCGYCCGPPEGKGIATFAGKMAFKSADFHVKGVGKAPAQQTMKQMAADG